MVTRLFSFIFFPFNGIRRAYNVIIVVVCAAHCIIIFNDNIIYPGTPFFFITWAHVIPHAKNRLFTYYMRVIILLGVGAYYTNYNILTHIVGQIFIGSLFLYTLPAAEAYTTTISIIIYNCTSNASRCLLYIYIYIVLYNLYKNVLR